MPRAWAYQGTDRWVDDPSTWRPILDGARCATKDQFLSAIAHTLEFPACFGGNWDAFDESLRDLLDLRDGGIGAAFGGRAGRPEQRVQLLIRSPELVLRDWPHDLGILVAILRAAARPHAGEDRAAFGLTLGPDSPTAPDLGPWDAAGLTESDLADAG